MQIVFLNPIGEIGGAERVLLSLLAELGQDDAKLQRRLILGSDGPLRAEAERLGVPTEVLPLPVALHTFGDSQLRSGQAGAGLRFVLFLLRAIVALPALSTYLLRLRRRLRALSPDVIHSNGIKTHLVAAIARPAQAKVVWHIHDFLGDRALVGRCLRLLRRRATLGIANSESVRDDAAALLRPLEVRTIYNGIDTDRFSPAAGDGDMLDRLAGRPPRGRDVVRVGLVATYARWKGHETFLEAAASVLRAAPTSPIRFYIVGGPIYSTAGSQYSEEELRTIVAKLGLDASVDFIPFQADAVPIYRALDVVVHAGTRREPFGLTIVEAMACARATVVAAAGGAAEIADAGTNALTFCLGNVDELATAIRTLAGDAELRERLGRGGRITAVDRFSAPSMGRRFAATYAELGRAGDR